MTLFRTAMTAAAISVLVSARAVRLAGAVGVLRSAAVIAEASASGAGGGVVHAGRVVASAALLKAGHLLFRRVDSLTLDDGCRRGRVLPCQHLPQQVWSTGRYHLTLARAAIAFRVGSASGYGAKKDELYSSIYKYTCFYLYPALAGGGSVGDSTLAGLRRLRVGWA
eukprot:636383-Prorocentrum_minimum.AAC.4